MGTEPEVQQDALLSLARKVGNDWLGSGYYDKAEGFISNQWKNLVWPLIMKADFTDVLEIASGHGRNTALLLPLCQSFVASDINAENTDFLAHRFPEELSAGRLSIVLNNGIDLAGIADASVSFIYSFDAMVHFDSDVVRAYIREAARVLKPGGTGFFHYSNVTADPSADYKRHPRWRNFMSQSLFNHWVIKEDMEVVHSVLAKWNVKVVAHDDGDTDALTYFRKPNFTAKATHAQKT